MPVVVEVLRDLKNGHFEVRWQLPNLHTRTEIVNKKNLFVEVAEPEVRKLYL